jgi:hypothetical protein
MKIFRRKKYRLIKRFFVFFLVLSWLLTGWPGIWFNPRFPKEIKVKAVLQNTVGWLGTEGSILQVAEVGASQIPILKRNNLDPQLLQVERNPYSYITNTYQYNGTYATGGQEIINSRTTKHQQR